MRLSLLWTLALGGFLIAGCGDPTRISGYGYDALNRQSIIVDASGGTANYGYDNENRVSNISDPRSISTTYSYDGLGDLASLQSPDAGNATAGYDSAGNPIAGSDARGVTTQRYFDALSRLTRASYSGGTNIVFQYDSTLSATACAVGARAAVQCARKTEEFDWRDRWDDCQEGIFHYSGAGRFLILCCSQYLTVW